MNIYQEVQSLQKSPIEVGGACSIAYFKIQDVLEWPVRNPVTGIIDNSIQMKPGKSIYFCQAVDKGRSYEEELKYGAAGPFTDTVITGTMAGNNTANIMSVDAMKHDEWGMILKDRGGYYRLIGNAERGAKFTYKHDAADPTSSRKVDMRWNWQHPNAAPVYQSQTFTITIGGASVTAGKITFIMRFRVGDAEAPMDDTDTTLTDPRFGDANLLVIASSHVLPQDDGLGSIDWTGLIERHIEKTFESDTITFVGGVVNEEIIEIYAFE